MRGENNRPGPRFRLLPLSISPSLLSSFSSGPDRSARAPGSPDQGRVALARDVSQGAGPVGRPGEGQDGVGPGPASKLEGYWRCDGAPPPPPPPWPGWSAPGRAWATASRKIVAASAAPTCRPNRADRWETSKATASAAQRQGRAAASVAAAAGSRGPQGAPPGTSSDRSTSARHSHPGKERERERERERGESAVQRNPFPATPTLPTSAALALGRCSDPRARHAQHPRTLYLPSPRLSVWCAAIADVALRSETWRALPVPRAAVWEFGNS